MDSTLVPEDFLADVRDAVGHLYDSAYLVRHPLLERMPVFASQDSTSAVRAFRKALVDVVEELRPPSDTPDDDPAWRPYQVIWHRFVVGKQLPELEAELALGKRQIQREQRRGLEVLGLKLWERFVSPTADDALAQDAVRLEADRLAGRRRVDVGEQVRRALESVAALADRLDVTLEVAELPHGLTTLGAPGVVRQLAVAALSLGLRLTDGEAVSVELDRAGDRVSLTVAWDWGPVMPEARTSTVTESVVALASGQGAAVTDECRGGRRAIRVSFAAAPASYVVVYIEDNEDVVALFRRYLSGHGYSLIGVAESASALERVSEMRPDAVLLDVMMQDLDGWEVLRRLKSSPELRGIPTVVCSVLHEPELATSLGADAYLRKPVRPAHLLECLAGLLTR